MTGDRRHASRLSATVVVALALIAPATLPAGVADASAATDTGARAPESPEIERLAWVIDSFLARPDLEGAVVGLFVESLESGAALFERNADLPMIPASNMKIVTGACALSVLGPDHRFSTDVLTDGALRGSVVEGDLFVRGAGDPSLVSEELWKLVEDVRALGIDRIAGDVVLDASLFDSLPVASLEAADGDRAYHARTGALSLNFNAVALHVRPGDREGDPVVAVLSPDTGFVELRNRGVTGSRRARSTLEIRRAFEDGRNTVTVSGRLPSGAPPRVVYRNIDDPVRQFGAALGGFLEEAGIVVEGTVRPGATPSDASVLVAHGSKPLSLIVRDLGKYSNNFVAETLLKAMAAREFGPPGTTRGGARVLERYLESVGADSGSYRVADGSGFSRSNRLSARTIARVLRRGLSEFETAYELAASLSVSGTDGTLEDRMGYPGLSGSVRAKTGLLDGVTAISGILETASGDEVLFSILVNGFTCEAWKVHDFEHAILTSIAGWSAGEE
jgi:D-alanyl-D-alanine carboxypeptidase/D-alanyl-D-alanine-endopeptidase (penicillin-binding protein 4)